MLQAKLYQHIFFFFFFGICVLVFVAAELYLEGL